MATVGERVHVASRKLGQPPREGVVTAVSGRLLRVKWSTGEESTIIPGAGSVSIGGKPKVSTRTRPPISAAKVTRSAKSAKVAKVTKTAKVTKIAKKAVPAKRVVAARKAAPAKKAVPAKKAPAKRAVAKKAPAKRAPAKKATKR